MKCKKNEKISYKGNHMDLETLRKEFEAARRSMDIADNDEDLEISVWMAIEAQYVIAMEEYIHALEEELCGL